MASRKKIAVLGAGVLGLSVAAELAQAGARVEVYGTRALHGSASRRSFSWLNAFSKHPPDYHRLRLLGIEHYRRYAKTYGVDWLRFDGTLRWNARDQPDTLSGLHDHLHTLDYPVEWVSEDAIRTLEPALSAIAVRGARFLYAPTEGWIDLPPWLDVLTQTIQAAGGSVHLLDGDTHIRIESGRATGLTLPDGARVDADAVVVAAGAATPSVLSEIGIDIPTASNKALLIHALHPQRPPKRVLQGPQVSIRARADGSLALHAGWADAEVTYDEAGRWSIDEHVVAEVLDQASKVLMGHPTLTPLHTGIGLRPIPGDRYTVAGGVEEVPGTYVAFSHSAATLAPAIAAGLAQEVLTHTPAPQLAAFRPARFEYADA